MEREVEFTNGFTPGYGPECPRCLYRTKKFECIIAKVEAGIQTQPKFERNSCKSYEANLAIRLGNLTTRTSLFFYNISPFLPRV